MGGGRLTSHTSAGSKLFLFVRLLKGGGVQGEGGNPKDSVWEDYYFRPFIRVVFTPLMKN